MALLSVEANLIDTSNECLISYLRQQNIDDEIFNSTASMPTLSDQCKRRINSEKDSVFIIAYQKYDRKSEFNRHFDCFMESIRNNEVFSHLLLKKAAIEAIKLSWRAKLNPKNWVAGRKRKSLKEVDREINAIEFENLFVCKYERKLEGMSEFLLEPKKIDNQKDDEDFCIGKFNNSTVQVLLETTENSINCDDLIKKVKEEILADLYPLYSDMKRNARKCVSTSLMNEDYFTPTLKMKAFALSPQSSERQQQKKVYVESMMALFRKILTECK